MSTVNGDVLYDEYGEITQCSFNAELLAGTPGLRSLPGILFVFPNFGAGVFHEHIDKPRKKTYAYI